MPLTVVCFCTYRTSLGSWRPRDYDAHDFIDAIKDRDINGHAYLPLRGRLHRFDNGNRQEVVGWFAAMVSDYLAAADVPPSAALVPVPGSKVDVRHVGPHRTRNLAEAIRAERPTHTVADLLRWAQPLASANEEGGPRRADLLFPYLRMTQTKVPTDVILVDDVLTSGGHLQACAAKLCAHHANVLLALAAGRSDADVVADPFEIRIEDLETFQP